MFRCYEWSRRQTNVRDQLPHAEFPVVDLIGLFPLTRFFQLILRSAVASIWGRRLNVGGLGKQGWTENMMGSSACWDTSVAKSFFSMLKNELVYRTVYATKA